MATNLRLRPDAEEAVRAEAERAGKSQQDVIRDAVDRYLGLAPLAGRVRAPRVPYRRPSIRIALPSGTTSLDLLDRDDRLR